MIRQMEPRVIFQDSDILVLDKPSGMIVNKSDTTGGERTVQEWVENKFRIQNSEFRVGGGLDFYNRAGIVHRLDKETSGILLVAKNPDSFLDLQRQFRERVVKKTYTALVHGKIDSEEGEINVPVGRLPWNRKRFGVLSGGRESVTNLKFLKELEFESHGKKEPLTLLELYPKTGRTHQIRVHLKYINRPIFSDPLYGGRKTSRNDRKILGRIFLHASMIVFAHPTSKKELLFESPLPEELNQFLKKLNS
ncbi:MAG: Pseudouridine synthase [uncultured bacterium]|nr:MAG: Pseudouridine synthase [uncultured bacterium]